LLGTQPQPYRAVSARLLAAVDSGSAKQGDPVQAMITKPLFGPDHKLALGALSRHLSFPVSIWLETIRGSFSDIVSKSDRRAFEEGRRSAAESPA
jgi:hypothetical protein